MSEIKRNGIFAAAVFALALPNLAAAETQLAASELGDEGDAAEIYVQLEEITAGENNEEFAGDDGSHDQAVDESGTDIADANSDVLQDSGAAAVEEYDVAEVEDTWATANGGGGGGGADGEEPIYAEFSAGSGEVQRDEVPVAQEDLDVALQSGVAPTASAQEDSAPILAASERFDPTLGINVHDKVAVAAQCAVLLDGGETYQAFYKLYCD